MSEETMFTIKTKLDASGIKDFEANVGKSLDSLSREFAEFSKKANIVPDTKDMKKAIEEAKKLLDSLEGTRKITLEAPRTEKTTKELAKLDDMIRQVARRHELLIEFDEGAAKKAAKEVSAIKDDLEALKKSGGEVPVAVKVDAGDLREAKDTAKELNDTLEEASQKRDIDVGTTNLNSAKQEVNDLDEIIATAKKSTVEIEREIHELNLELDRLGKERKVILSKPQTEETKKELAEIDKQIKSLERKRQIRIDFDSMQADAYAKSLNSIIVGVAALTTAAVAATGALAGFAVKTAASFDQIDKQSQRLGLSVKTFQELKYIATQSGTSINTLSSAMKGLVKQATSNSSAFKQLGVNVKDSNGKLKDQETLFNETIAALQGVEAGTARSRIAFDLFGKASEELEPLLNAGASGMEAMRKEAHELGLVLDRETIAKGVAANAAFDSMGATLKNVFISALSGALPYLQKASEAIAKFAAEIAPLAQNFIPSLVSGLDSLTPLLAGLATYAGVYAANIATAATATLAAKIATFSFAGALKALTAAAALNPIGAIAVALGVLVAAIVWTVKNWDYFVAQVEYGAKSIYVALLKTFTEFENMATRVWATVNEVFYKGFNELVNIALQNIQTILNAFGQIPGAVGEPFREASAKVAAFNKTVSDGLQTQIDWTKKAAAERIADNEKKIAEHNAELKRIEEKRDAKVKALDDTKKEEEKAEGKAPGKAITYTSEKEKNAYKQTTEYKIAELKKQYEAQQDIASRTASDSKALAASLLKIDKDYYANLEKLLQKSYEDRRAKKKEVTDAEIAELNRVAEKSRELALASDTSDLEARYKAQQKLASETITDQQKLKSTLLALEKTYYSDLEKVTRDSYEKQLEQGKRLADAQVANLKKLAETNKELSLKTTSKEDLEQEYRIRKEVANKTIADEKVKVAELKRIHREYLEGMLKLLEAQARAEAQATGRVSEATAESIKGVRGQLSALDNDLTGALKALGSYLSQAAQSLGSYMDSYYDARIQSLDAALERELRLIENAHEREMELYEKRLEQYEDLDERKEKLTEEHQERLEDLNWKAQEHITEDEYNAIMLQRQQEEEKYAESMAALEADTLMRDEIRLQQETAEQEYLIRKEALEKEYAIKRAKMERKQAEASKTTAMFSALINVAQAITLAWAQGGFYLGAIFAAVVAAAGALQIAAIASRPLPEIPSFSQGGLIGGANKHLYPHLPGPDNPHDKTLLWGAEGEYVLDKRESGFYQALRDGGIKLEGLFRNGMMPGQEHMYLRAAMASTPVPAIAAPVDNSKHIEQTINYHAQDKLTFSEARRAAERAGRDLIRRLG